MDYGTAQLEPDPNRAGAWVLRVDGVAQSYVDLADLTHLEFEYMRRLASVVDTAAPAGRPLRVLHLGGGAFSLPRYVLATRPGSVQVVVDRDAALIDLVQSELPLPAEADVEVRIADARAAVEDPSTGDGFDLVVADVYQAARMPRSVATVEFAAAVAARLRPGGTFVANVVDLPPLAFSKVQAATLATVFADVCVLAEPGLLRGRRYGNVVLAAVTAPGRLPVARLTRAAARDPFPNRLVHGADLHRFIAGAGPMADADPGASPDAAGGRLLRIVADQG